MKWYNEPMSTVRTGGRIKLLPRIGFLFLLNLIPAIPWETSFFVFLALVPSLVYTAMLILTTRDTIRQVDQLHLVDLWLCRLSGPGVVLVTLTQIVLFSFVQPDFLNEPKLTVLLAQFTCELGVLLATACLVSGAEIRHVPPALIWKIISAPLLLMYVVFLVVGTVSSMVGGPD